MGKEDDEVAKGLPMMQIQAEAATVEQEAGGAKDELKGQWSLVPGGDWGGILETQGNYSWPEAVETLENYCWVEPVETLESYCWVESALHLFKGIILFKHKKTVHRVQKQLTLCGGIVGGVPIHSLVLHDNSLEDG